ncbi:hypothetical protein [Candidatus Nitrosotenuis sp. DW1]|uniref:hypothetical protein n=1 Tax=Candidatus Nitrosotenuis sp. DW1 TaxID=2259672 RepID=UPI0015CE83B8|nr:hypothetical protein [Candidatus Nitrosotenuis sp. DW1]QLH09257.1 hypothetical protein DSQ19_07055 [Candidatus Nitrosotenuis sp. DW1]
MNSSLVFALLAASLFLPNLAFADAGTIQATVNGSTFDVTYDATGLDVTGIDTDTESSTVTVFVTTSDISSTLKITLDRIFFDSRTAGEDDDFLVLTDGFEATFEESKDDASRTLTIDVPEGTNSVDIIALGSASFGLEPVSAPPEEVTPEEVPEETVPEEVPEEMTCGPGTVLDKGVCVLEQAEPEEETVTPPEVPEEMTCGPGTVLKDGTCVLDETCGPGTILSDGVCILDQSQVPRQSGSQGMGFDLIMPIAAAFVIAFVIMIILWSIGKAGRSKN